MKELIKIFDFKGHSVRIITNDSNQVFFVAKDICDVLGYSNTSKAISDNCKREGITTGYVPHPQSETKQIEVTLINEGNFYRLVLKSKKKESEVFESWVCDKVLPSIRKGELIFAKEDSYLKQHLDVTVQKGFSKKINAINFSHGGITETIDYNRKNCLLHTNKRPHEVVRIGKDFGLKSKQCSSAKEVLRNLKPELACSMSFTDKLVSENGIVHELAAKTSIELAQPLFKRLMELGLKQNQLGNG